MLLVKKLRKIYLIDIPSSLVTAINLGYQTISNSIYFENQIDGIAHQIVDLPEWYIDPEKDDITMAVECLTKLQKTSTILSKEEKNVLKVAVKKMAARGCSCCIM